MTFSSQAGAIQHGEPSTFSTAVVQTQALGAEAWARDGLSPWRAAVVVSDAELMVTRRRNTSGAPEPPHHEWQERLGDESADGVIR